jgi:hypothetical protein
MATREETDKIRALLQQQANQRVNPFMKGLSMLTGGIAGEFTGTNEDIRNRNYAKRALMEQDIDALKEERVIARTEAARVQALKDEVEREARRTAAEERRQLLDVTGAEEVLTGADKTYVGPVEQAQEIGRRKARVQKLATGEREAAEKARLIGRLGAEMGATEKAAIEAGLTKDYSDLDINTLRRMEGASDVSIRNKEEARRAKQDEGRLFVSRSSTGAVNVQGPVDLIKKFENANPGFFTEKKGSPYKVSMRETEDGRSFNVDFGDMNAAEVESIQPELDKMKKAYGVSSQADLSGGGAGAGAGAITAKPLPKAPAATPGDPMVGRGSGKPRGEVADMIAKEVASQPDMYGPPTPREQFRKTGMRLSELESRGGASAYGAPQTLTSPFNEAVASELNIQPERVGGESVFVKEAKAVVASQFPTEQWNSLPQEVKNRIYIQALNESAAKMAKPPSPKSILGLGYAESPFAPYSYKTN